MDNDIKYSEYIKLLEANKNLILTGAPGTGKSYLAREIAKKMGAEYQFVQFHPSYDYTDFVEGLRPTIQDNNGNIGFERRNGVFKEFCRKVIKESVSTQFVSTKNESQFVVDNYIAEKALKWFKEEKNGIEIKSNRSESKYIVNILDGKIKLKAEDGKQHNAFDKGVIDFIKTKCYDKKHQTYEPTVGHYICENYPGFVNESLDKLNSKSAVVSEKKKYVFIIDEINRGEISKIFGELFFCIDPGYRGEKGLIQTQYQNMVTDENDPFYEGFYVPENVYIIGTMNDIDRSVESIDFAIRRRFAWKEVKANENVNMLNILGELKDDVVKKMIHLNNTIWDEKRNEGIEGLGTAYHIGGAYFLKIQEYLKEYDKYVAYRKLWDNHLRPLLFEYLRGTMNISDKLRDLEKSYYSE